MAALTSMAAYAAASAVRRSSARGKHALAAISGAHRLDTSAYPRTLEDYVGQEKAKRQLKAAIARAEKTGTPLRHTLITSGVPGVGKTGLAAAISGELGTNIRAVSGKITMKDIRPTLLGMQDRDILFIDEIHQMVVGGKASAEWLLHLLQDGVLMGPTGPEQMPDITVIAATTDAGRLPETILSRFKIRCQLEPYTDQEALVIVSMLALKASRQGDAVYPADEVLQAIVQASANNPRTMSSLLESYTDLAYTTEAPDFAEVLEWQGLTADGLDRTAQRVLVALVLEFDGQAGENALKQRLREPGGLHFAERVLQEKGLIQFTAAGRAITTAGALRGVDLATAGVIV